MLPPDDQAKHDRTSIPQDEEMLQQMRREARIRKDVVLALHVTLVLADGLVVEAQCSEASVGGVAVRVRSEDHRPIEPGTRVQLTLCHPSRDRGITSEAQVTSVQHEDGHACYVLRFLKVPDVVGQLDPFYRRWLNRRRHVRVVPDLGTRIAADLKWKQGELRGRIHDISLSGLGIAVSLTGAAGLEHNVPVQVTFSLPGAVLPITCGAQVAVVHAFKKDALIGLAFDPAGGVAAHALEIQRYVEARQKSIRRWNDVMALLKSA